MKINLINKPKMDINNEIEMKYLEDEVSELRDKNQKLTLANKALKEQLSINGVSIMLPLLEVDRETLAILIDYYKKGENIEAIKMLIAEVKRTYYHFGIKEARKVLEGN